MMSEALILSQRAAEQRENKEDVTISVGSRTFVLKMQPSREKVVHDLWVKAADLFDELRLKCGKNGWVPNKDPMLLVAVLAVIGIGDGVVHFLPQFDSHGHPKWIVEIADEAELGETPEEALLKTAIAAMESDLKLLV